MLIQYLGDNKSEEVPSLFSDACNEAFGEFVETYDKKYDSDEEAEMRQGIFCDRKATIEEKNAIAREEGYGNVVAINAFADMTEEEWAGMHGTRRP